jgi:large subunit ribosomal protein L21
MFAVIKTGGKQYRVAPADVVEVEKLSGEAGDAVAFGDVLMVGSDDGVAVGSPTVAGASVAGEIVRQRRTATILVFKKRRHGHRQHVTLVRITEILTDGKAPAVKASAEAEAPANPKRTRATKPAAAEAAPAEAAANADKE